MPTAAIGKDENLILKLQTQQLKTCLVLWFWLRRLVSKLKLATQKNYFEQENGTVFRKKF